MKLREIMSILAGDPPRRSPFAIIAQFDSPAALYEAAKGVRERGYKKFDVYSPFPIHGMDQAMGLSPSRVPFVVFFAGLVGALAGFSLQYFTVVVDYSYVVSGKPFLSIPAFVPITFEVTILFAAIAAVVSMFMFNLLPMLYHPLLKHRGFERATDDGFFLAIEASDPQFDPDSARRLLESLGGMKIDLVEP